MPAPIAEHVELIARGVCPVCGTRSIGKRPRHACMNHIRRHRSPRHVLWKAVYYGQVFPHGRHSIPPSDVEGLPERLLAELESAYEPDVLRRLAARIVA